MSNRDSGRLVVLHVAAGLYVVSWVIAKAADALIHLAVPMLDPDDEPADVLEIDETALPEGEALPGLAWLYPPTG